jgi:hypothetical protein
MSTAELRNLESQLELLSFAEKISVIGFLARLVQNTQEMQIQTTKVRSIKRRFGSAKGKFSYPMDFDEDNEEIAKLFGVV